MSYTAATVQARQMIVVPKGKLRIWIGVFGCVAYIIAYLDRVNVSVLIADPIFTKTLGIAANKSTQGLLMSVFLFTYGVSCFLGGPAIQRFGVKRTLFIGLLSWALLTGFMGAVSSIAFLLFCRALLGLGESVLSPGISKLVQTWFPVHERAKANGAWYVGLQLGYVLSTPLVAWWVAAVGWRGSYYILALLGIVPIIMCVSFVYDHPSKHPRITSEEVNYIASQENVPVAKAKASGLDWGFLKSATFWYVTIVYSLTNAEIWGFLSWIPSYFKVTLGFSWAAMGLLAMLPYACATLAVMVFMPLMDRYNRRALFVFLSSVIFALFTAFAVGASSRMAAVAVLSLAYAAGGPRTPALFTMVQNITTKEQVGTATGVFVGVAYVIASLTPYAIGVLYNMTGSLKSGFYFLAALAFLACLVCIPLVRKRL